MYCRECGQAIEGDSKFCAYCGAKQNGIDHVSAVEAEHSVTSVYVSPKEEENIKSLKSLQEDREMATEINIAKTNRKKMIIAPALVLAVLVCCFCVWHFSWLPINRDLSKIVGKKLSVVRFLHPVTQNDKGQYFIDQYELVLSKGNLVIGVERKNILSDSRGVG